MCPVSPNSASVIFLLAHDLDIQIISGLISSTIMFNSFYLLTMLLVFKHTHLYPASEMSSGHFVTWLCVFVASCPF